MTAEQKKMWNGLSEVGRVVLARMHDFGGYLEAGHLVLGGRVLRVSVGTLKALASHNLCTMHYPGNGVHGAGRLTDAGRSLCEARAKLGGKS